LQRTQLTHETRITAVADRDEIFGVKLGKKRIAILQVWVVRAQARFEKLAAFADCFQPTARGLAVAIVSSQIAERLFAFEYCCRSNFFWVWPIARHVGAIPAFR